MRNDKAMLEISFHQIDYNHRANFRVLPHELNDPVTTNISFSPLIKKTKDLSR